MKTPYLLILLLFLTACEQYEIIDTEMQFKSKTVAFFFIKADSSLASLMLSKTTPITSVNINNQPDYIANAQIYLTYKDAQYFFVYDEVAQRYSVNLAGETFMPGEQCKLSVTTTNETVMGDVVIPQTPNISYQVNVIPILKGWIYNYKVRIKYTLQSGGEVNILNTPAIVNSDSSEALLTLPTGVEQIIKLKQGETVEQEFETYGGQFEDNAYRVKLLVTAYSDAYAKYYNKYIYGGSSDFGNPFSAPTTTFSNLSNGIGIFGATNMLGEQSFLIK